MVIFYHFHPQSQEQSPLTSPLLHYLCSSVFPLLTSCAAMLPQLLAHLHIIINLLMCCCRLGTTCQLTAKQLSNLTAFLTEAYRFVLHSHTHSIAGICKCVEPLLQV